MDIKNSKIDLINPNSIGVVFEAGKHKGQNMIWMFRLGCFNTQL